MAASTVVVIDVPLKGSAQVAFTDDQHPVGALGTDDAHEPLREGIHSRCLWCGEYAVDADGGEYCVEGGGELCISVPNQIPEPVSLLEVRGEVPCELCSPDADGVAGHVE
ncbi:hypothetical protein ABIA31_002934 [Catenulispora sp. MAP5-51]